MEVKIWKGYWSVQDTLNNPNYLFIFGDNDIQKGKKGQALIRDMSNAMGIPTKKYPSLKQYAYYTDTELEQNKFKIDLAIDQILAKLQSEEGYLGIYLPEDGLGTGLAKLSEKAPKTFEYLNRKISDFL